MRELFFIHAVANRAGRLGRPIQRVILSGQDAVRDGSNSSGAIRLKSSWQWSALRVALGPELMGHVHFLSTGHDVTRRLQTSVSTRPFAPSPTRCYEVTMERMKPMDPM